MCCLFGLIDTRLRFTGKQKSKMLHALATVSEVRGTDATGIAYHTGEQLCIYKRPIPGHKLKFYMRDDTRVGMGHTRMTTQGKASKNRNNHPFRGIVRGEPFALAHNGVLYNDLDLRRKLGLPKTRIETDSYIGVQLIEQKGTLDFSSLRYMAEQVEGSFTFTVLDAEDSLYIVKGDNPFCLYYFPRCGLYLYASTEEILCHAIQRISANLGSCFTVPVKSGEILKISAKGRNSVRVLMTPSCTFTTTILPCSAMDAGEQTLVALWTRNKATWTRSSPWQWRSDSLRRKSIIWQRRASPQTSWKKFCMDMAVNYEV